MRENADQKNCEYGHFSHSVQVRENPYSGKFNAVVLKINLKITFFFPEMRAVLLFSILLFCGIVFSEVIQEDPKDDAPVVNNEGESEYDLQSESDDVIDEDDLQSKNDDAIDEDDESKETSEGSESDTEQEEIEENNEAALEDEETQDEEDSEVEDPKRHRPSRQCKAT